VRKAAVLMLMVGEEVARDILPQLSNAEIQRLANGTRLLRDLEAEEVVAILEEYNQSLESAVLWVDEGASAFRGLAIRTLGQDRARAVLDRPTLALSSAFVDLCSRADPETLARVLTREHPQTVAVVLSALPPAQAGPLLAALGEERRPDVVRRVASLKAVNSEVLRQAEESLTREVLAAMAEGQIRVDGSNIAVSIMKEVSVQAEEQIITALEAEAPELAADIRRRMFIFDDLVEIDDRGIQTLLREIPSNLLRVALRSAQPTLLQRIFRNMSERAAKVLEEDMASSGPVPLGQVEEAREAIVQTALELARGGKITMPGRGGGGDALV
jgi:flagellar motor switch protein FliG